jgi:hypothetical protein
MANVLIAVLATVLGYTTSAVVAQVRSEDPAATRMVVVDARAQFRPIVSAHAPAFVSPAAPGWNERAKADTQVSAARAFVITRSVGLVR